MAEMPRVRALPARAAFRLCPLMRIREAFRYFWPVRSNDGYVTMGGPDEATYYVTECGAAWHRTPGAVAWLTNLTATLAPKRQTPATH